MPTFHAFFVQFSEPEMESDDDEAPKTHAAIGSAAEAEKCAEKTASSSSGEEEVEDEADVNIVDSDANAREKKLRPMMTQTRTAAHI